MLADDDAWEVFPVPAGPPVGYPKGAKNQCEHDSLRLAQGHPDLTFIAGYFFWEALWYGHFFCLDREGRVIDTSPMGFGDTDPPEVYVGVRLPTEEVTQAAASSPKSWGRRFVRKTLYVDELPANAQALTDPWLFPEFFTESERVGTTALEPERILST